MYLRLEGFGCGWKDAVGTRSGRVPTSAYSMALGQRECQEARVALHRKFPVRPPFLPVQRSRMRGQGNMGRLRAVVVLLGVTLVLGVPAALPAGSRDTGVKVTVLGASQRTLLGTRSVRVRVVAKRALTVRLAPAGSRARAVRFRHRGTRTVSLALGPATRRALARCARQSLVVRARVGRRSLVARRLVSLDPARCRSGAGGSTSPSGSGGAGGAPGGSGTGGSGPGSGPAAGGGGSGGTGNVGPVTVDGAENTN